MKKVIFKNLFRVFLVAVAFFFVGVSQTNAQSAGLSDGLYSPPPGNFVNIDEAQTRLVDAITTQKNLLAGFTPGTAIYNATEKKYLYYKATLDNIQSGVTIPQSIANGLRNISFSDVAGGGTPKQTLKALKDEVTQLLTA